jgi:CBS domain-containing protein
MSRRASSLPRPAALRRRLTTRLLSNRAIRDDLISVAGLISRPVRNPNGEEFARVADVVVSWEGETYPPVTGLIVRVGRRTSFAPIAGVEHLDRSGVRSRSGRVDLVGYHHRPGEVALASDVIDHQLVDVDGVRVVRAADLYLARLGERLLLVGVDVSVQSLLRRLGPARFRSHATPDRVIDWAAIQPFSAGEGPVRLRRTNQELHRLRPAELADLLEQLGRTQRRELLAAIDPDIAADALEEMEREPLAALLTDAPAEQAAALIAGMEPDEAVEALRDLDDDRRAELFDAMPADEAASLERMLRYDPESAGGIMTTHLVIVESEVTIGEVRRRLRAVEEHASDIDNVSVIDADGHLVDEISLFEIAVATDDQQIGSLVGEPFPITVEPDAELREVVDCLVANRRSSLVVVDADGRPIGRILADDVVDALAPGRGRFHFPRVVE